MIQYEIFTVPVLGGVEELERMNRFFARAQGGAGGEAAGDAG